MDHAAHELQHRLITIVDCSRQMLERAEARDWEALDQLQSRLEELLAQLFSKPPEPSEADLIISCIQQVVALDGEIIERIEAARCALAEGLRKIKLGRRARLAYGENSR
jgi:hypothetical protein